MWSGRGVTTIFLISVIGTVARTDASPAARWPRVLLIGDSLTQFSFRESGRWGSLVADRLTERPVHRQAGIADVINRGFGGFTSADYLNQADDILCQERGEQVAAVTVMLGTNDAARGVSAADYRSNIRSLLDKLINEYRIGYDRLILLCPPPTDRTRKQYDTVAYKPEIVSLAHDLNVTAVNLYDVFEEYPRKSDLYRDGVHFSPLGSQLVFETLMPIIQRKVDEYRGEHSFHVHGNDASL